MKEKNEFVVVFSGLKEGVHGFNYLVNQSFFEKFSFEPNFSDGKFEVELKLDKRTTFMEFLFSIKGVATFECDLTLEPFQKEVTGKCKIIVKFGDKYNDDEVDMLEIPRNSSELDLSQYIYETLILAVPSKNIHPKVLSGEIQSDMLDKLSQYQVKEFDEDTI